MKLDAFLQYRIAGDIQHHYNKLLYNINTIDYKKDRYYSNLWIMDTFQKKSLQFTHDKALSHSQKFSPNGEWISYLSNKSGKEQLYLLPTRGGESRCLTDLDGYFQDISWSPNGYMIAFSFQRKDNLHQKKTPRKIDKFYFKYDGIGLVPEDYWHIWLLDLQTNQWRQITSGRYNHSSPVWSSDSKKIAFVANREKDCWIDIDNSDLWILSLDNFSLKKIETPYGSINSPSWSPNGRYIAYTWKKNEKESPGNNDCIWIVDLTSGKPKDISSRLDRSCINLAIEDTLPPSCKRDQLIWQYDSSAVYSLVSDMGRCHLYKFPIADQKAYPITSGDIVVYSYSIYKNTAFVFASSTKSPSLLYKIKIPEDFSSPNKMILLEDFNPEVRKEKNNVIPDFFECEGVKRKVYGFLYKPPHFQKNKKYPFILSLHGGPYLFYGSNFFHEAKFLSSQGFIVLCINQGGSQGYGESHASLIRNAWGKADFPEIMKAVDTLLEEGYIDSTKMGVMGGSYGGFLTNWIITHTNRFRAAITQRCISEFSSFFYGSDIGPFFHKEFGGTPWKNWEMYRERSPLFLVDKIETPLLIIHSEKDYRTPILQGEQLYLALKYERKEVEMLYFPEENHNLSREGKPSNRLFRLNSINEWFKKYLIDRKEE